MTALKDHLVGMYFQMIKYESPHYRYTFIEGWPDLGKRYYDHSMKEWVRGSSFLQDTVNQIVAGSVDKYDKAEKLYEYVAQNYRTQKESIWHINNNIKDIVKRGYGTVNEKTGYW